MKKTIALILTLCTLLCTLTACKSRRSKYLPKDTDTETDTSTGDAGDAEVSRYIHGDNPYAGMTGEELKNLYFDTYVAHSIGRCYNSPYYHILNASNGWIAFNKLTGDITTLCKDPLCDHKSCVFSKFLHHVLVAEDRLYTIQEYGDGICLFSFDYQFNDAKKLLTWNNREDAPIDDRIFYWNGKLYYQVNYHVKGETLSRVCVYDLSSGKDYWLEPEETMRIHNLRLVYEGYLYYWRTGNHSIWRYDLRTGEDICLLDEEKTLNAEEGDRMLTLNAVLPGSKTLCLCVISLVGEETFYKYYYYDIDTKGMKRTYGTDNPLGEYTVSLKDHVFTDDESFKNDPFYDFYKNDFYKGLNKVVNQYGGDLYYNTDNREETETLLHASVDGIPVGFSIGYNHDGKCLYVAFRTYRGYTNKYNPDYKEKGRAGGSTISEEELFLHNGYAIIDIENKKILTVCQDDVEYEWYPQFDWYTENSN